MIGLEKLFIMDQRGAKILKLVDGALTIATYGKANYAVGIFTPVNFMGKYYWKNDERYEAMFSEYSARNHAVMLSQKFNLPIYNKVAKTRIILEPNTKDMWKNTLINLSKKELMLP